MNKTSTLVVSTLMLALPFISSAQYSPGLSANFGVDGDVLSGTRQNGTFNQQNTHDWFFKAGGGANLGKGIIDTAGTSVIASKLIAGENYCFNRGMLYSRYSNQDGYLLLDGRYGRDNFALTSSGANSDKTAYQGGQKNGSNPTVWATFPLGSAVADKADIIDGYVHFRRNGTIINGTSSSHLMAIFGLSTLANNGDRFMDIEFYASRINYDSVTGVFSNSGPVTTGGHTKWEFNTDGSIKKFGDMTITFEFNSSTVSEIAIWMWVSKTDYETRNPRDFDFVPGEINGVNNNPDYGYVKIQPNAGNTSIAWGSANTADTKGPEWGTANKALGSNSNNYNYAQYSAGQFAEGGIDLSQLGIDPAYIVGGDPCAPVFTRVMFKSRSAHPFTASLQDFIGPFSFLDAPTAPAQIAPPAVLKCNLTSTTLSPSTVVTGAQYTWSTSNGNIVTNPNATTITVNKAGKYYLSSSLVVGCPVNIDSTIVSQDYYQPVASAYTVGTLDATDPYSFVNLQGGDVNLSNFATPYGGSAGLNWKWTGPDGFTSNTRNTWTTKEGTYTLELTELRNGCKDTAITPVFSFQSLPVKIKEFTAVKKENDKVLIKWETADETPKDVELMRSFNGVDFTTISFALAHGDRTEQTYSYIDNVSSRPANRVYYKLKITENSGAVKYSWVVNILYGENTTVKLSASPNPATNYTVLSITSENTSTGTLQIVDMSGRILHQKGMKLEQGTNNVMLNEVEKLKKGMYIIRILANGEVFTQKLIKSD